MSRPECVFEAKDSLGEGPCWHPRERALYWTDVPSKKIKRWNPASGAHASLSFAKKVARWSVLRGDVAVKTAGTRMSVPP